MTPERLANKDRCYRNWNGSSVMEGAFKELLGEVHRLRAVLNTIANHSDLHSDFPHGVEGLQQFAARALKK